ncbi:MAG TPA: ABC transporter permease [Planctomycetaceae bacterium]|nr:ABC transporter permease [Planctomycetaceae bacterium]
MNLFTIAWKSLKQRFLSSLLTALSIGLGVMLMVLVLVMFGAVDSAFTQRSIAYDLIVGPKGSDLQLVLSAVYRMQPPIENLPYLYLEQLKNDRRVISAVPLAFGDVTQEGSFPIIGTIPEYFENEYMPGHAFRIRGKRINGQLDTIIGYEVARQNGWDIGSTFTIVHGGAESGHVHDEKFVVVAVLAPTGTANDRTVFLNLEGFYALAGHSKPVKEVEQRLRDFYAADPERLATAMEQIEAFKKIEAEEAGAGHDHAHHHHTTPDAMKEVTAILIRTRPDTPFDAFSLAAELQKGYQAMAVNPVKPIQKLVTGLLGNIQKALVALTAIIILVSGVGIFVSIYNSMSDRRREIGIMRALGAGRMHVFGIILAESTLLCIGGGLLGWIIGHSLAVASAPWLIRQTGLLINPWAVNPWEATLFPVLVGLAALVGFLPAMTAYRTNVADALSS